jgi:hypothetical protein
LTKISEDILLTENEKEVLDHLADAYNAFVLLDNLGDHHPHEFAQAIHVAEHLVMIRPAIRCNEMFRRMKS